MSDKGQKFDQQLDSELKISEYFIDQEEKESSVSIKKGLIRNKECINGIINYRKAGQQFSLEEDRLILELVLNFGPKFQKIHKHFPGKTLAMVKNRYYKYLRYRWEVLNPSAKANDIDKQINKVSQLTLDNYEILSEKHQTLSTLLNQERDALVNTIAERCQLPDAKIYAEYLVANIF
ncbi:unnamed protein product [Paramecium octaurelia]|uniref:HTH myb-type domain-containing protein n=1 Tax=Paramecium octaurelia TaxID=43137 RepID=A0A8S1TRT8_PAROT|nr:unnamed protein product [Paramecium octaurelia]